jgi:two-component system, cell cycle sensor histidine kinase and response regulator CckA
MTDQFLQFLARSNSRPLAWRLAFAAAAILVATAARLSLAPAVAGHFIAVTFYPAVAIAAMVGGAASGALAILLSVVAIFLLFGSAVDASLLFGEAVFIGGAAVIVGMAGLLQAGQARLAQAEKTRCSAEQLGQFVAQAPVALAMFDRDLRYVATSRRWLTDFGLDGRDLAAMSLGDAFPEIADAWKSIGHAAPGDEAATKERRVIREDGSVAWLNIHVRGVRQADGEISHGVAAVEDISERKGVEALLLGQQQRLSADLDAMARIHEGGPAGPPGEDLKPILQQIVDAAISIAGADFGNIQILDEATGVLRIVAHKGFPDWWIEYWNDEAAAPGACATALAQRERVIVEDVEKSPIFLGSPALDIQRRAHVRAVISTPLTSRSGRLVGVFSTHYRIPHRPDQQTLRLLDLLSHHAADIIEKRRAIVKLRESEARYRAIVATAFSSIVTIDENGGIQEANPATRTMFGYEEGELIGRNVAMLMFEEHATKHDGYIAAYKRTGVGKVIGVGREFVGRRKDGAPVEVELAVAEWRDAAGKRYFTGSMRNISSRKRAEDALRKFARVVEQTASIVIITDSRGAIEYVNPRFTEITGYAAEEAIGRKPSLLKSGHTSQDEYRRLWRTITGGGVWRGEFHNKRKDGSLYWEAAQIMPIRDAAGAITHFAAIKDDITGRKEIEGQLAAAQRMKAIGQLAGGVAHDFNNLLAVIAGNLELIQQRCDDAKISALVRPALQAAESGAAFNRRLLSLGGRRAFSAKPLVVNERIRAIRDLLERAAGAQLVVTCDLADDLWASMVDPGEVDSALLNLVANSRDAMPDGGKIVVETRNVTLDAAAASRLPKGAREGDYVRVAVADRGRGMNQEVLERAFEPFFTTKEEGKGSGLGLSGVQNSVWQAGGFVTIESREGDGATVCFYLPCARGEAAPRSPGDARDVPLGDGEVVVVVDDDDRVLDVTIKRVEALGYVAEAARSGAEALEILKSGLHADLVLSDIVMPGGMSGFDLARLARAEAPGVKVVLATGFNSKASADEEAALDASVLHKPYTREQLAKALAGALGKGAHSDDTSPAKT